MKKRIAAFAALLMLFSLLAGCGTTPVQENEPIQSVQNEEPAAAPETPQPTAVPAAEEPSGAEPAPEGRSGKALVVYYSATGNTARVIQDQ